MSTIDCIIEERVATKLESALSEWRLAVDRRSNDIWPAPAARPIPARSASESLPASCLHRARSHSAVVGRERSKRKRGTSAVSNPGLARLKWRLRHGGLYQPARPSASSWSPSRGSFALRLLTHACPNCYDSGAYFQIEKCCGWAYTVIALPVAVRYSWNSPWRTRLHPVRPI